MARKPAPKKAAAPKAAAAASKMPTANEAKAASAAKALIHNAIAGTATGGTYKVPFNSGTPDVFLKQNNISTDLIRKLSGFDDNFSDKDCYHHVCALIHYGKITEKDF